MWLNDLLRKMTQGPNVGETFRNYIGCYLLGTEIAESDRPEYIAAPTSLSQLEAQIRNYLQDFLTTQQSSTSAQQTVQTLLEHLPEKLQEHIASDMQRPFLTLDGVQLFIRKGVRQRCTENGKLVE